MKFFLNLNFKINNGKIELNSTVQQETHHHQIKQDNETTYITIGNSAFGFSEINYSNNNVNIKTDEFCSFPLFYYYSSDILIITSCLDQIPNRSSIDQFSIKDFISNGYYFESTGFNNIYITQPHSIVCFSLINDQFHLSSPKKIPTDSVDANHTFNQLYADLVQSTEQLLLSSEFHTVDLTGGVDTRLILGILFELGYEKRYTFVTDRSDDNDRKLDFEIASQICSKYQLRHVDKSQKSSIQLEQSTCLSGKYGSEFFSGEFSNFWGEYQSLQRRTHYPNLPYLENHISPLNDLYYIYGTQSFIYSVTNLYNIHNTPYKMRNSLLSLNKIPIEKQKKYAFHTYLFNHKLKWLTKFPFFSNFANFNNDFLFIKKKISPKDSSTYQVNNLFSLDFLEDHCKSILIDTQISLFDKKIRLARVKLLNEYYTKYMN